jgi:hypothetical protein
MAKKRKKEPSRRDLFIEQLAVYLVGDQARMSILCGLHSPHALAWATLRGYTPLLEYPTVEEATATLRAFLLGDGGR